MASRKKKFRETVSSNMGSSLLEFDYPAYTIPPAVPEPDEPPGSTIEPSAEAGRMGAVRSGARRAADRPEAPREADPA